MGKVVVRRVVEECAHVVKLAAYLTSAVWDVYSVLAFHGVTFEDESVDVLVERMINDTAITDGIVVL